PTCASISLHPGLPLFPTRRSSDLRRCRYSLTSLSVVRSRPVAPDRPDESLVLLSWSGAVGSSGMWLVSVVNALSPLFRSFLVRQDRKSTRLNSSHGSISYAVFCFK